MTNRRPISFLVLLLAVCVSVFFSSFPFIVEGVGNNPPSVSSVFISSISNTEASSENSIIPSPGTTKTVYVYGDVMDLDGDTDISSVAVSFYRTSLTSALCDSVPDEDPNQCYRATCTLNVGDPDTNVRYDCEVPLQYYADATTGSGAYATDDWTVLVIATDAAAVTGDNAGFPTTTEIGELNAATVQSTIAWGSLDLGTITTAANNVSMTVTQAGNTIADLRVNGTGLTCASGMIPVNMISYALTDVDGGTVLTNTPADILDFNLPLRTDAVVTQNLYWNISIPDAGVGGSCTGSLTVVTIAG